MHYVNCEIQSEGFCMCKGVYVIMSLKIAHVRSLTDTRKRMFWDLLYMIWRFGTSLRLDDLTLSTYIYIFFLIMNSW